MQKSLSYSKGITTSPSGMLADDTELAESVGMVYKAGEMHPIQSGVPLSNGSSYKLVYVHKGPDYSNAILYDSLSGELHFAELNIEEAVLEEPYQDPITIGILKNISSVGNTIVATTDKGLCYILYKGGKYKLLGNELPKPIVSFRTTKPIEERYLTEKSQLCDVSQFVKLEKGYVRYDENGDIDKDALENSDDITYYKHTPIDDRVDDLQAAISGHVAKILNLVKEKNAFAFPFFVRYALRLFDGTYTRISAPIAVFPTVTRNNRIYPAYWAYGMAYDTDTDTNMFLYRPSFVKLQYNISVDNIKEWGDIVKDIVVFASDEVMPFTIDGKWNIVHPQKSDGTRVIGFIGIHRDFMSDRNKGSVIKFRRHNFGARDVILPEKLKDEHQIIEELLSKTQFFKLFSVKAENMEFDIYKDAPIKDGVVSTLLQQQQLPVDDYYGWTTLRPKQMLSYNKRLNIFNIERYPFEGFSSFIAFPDWGWGEADDGTDYRLTNRWDRQLRYYVHIISDTIDAWVQSDSCDSFTEFAHSWFFYPDPNATELVVEDERHGVYYQTALTRHEGLNGAYYFRWLPDAAEFEDNILQTPTPDPSAHELLTSQIFTSVVNNPFVFQASGDNTVGTGSILGIAANTEPISQGQFGQYPLLVFTTEGIYGMSVNSEGLYSASYPMSREVCNNPASITPTGSLVFFTSAKGLMAVSGGNVSCVSTQLQGRNPSPQFLTLGDGNFIKFLSGSFLAYDYRDSLLHILNPTKKYEYVYSIPDGTFAKSELSDRVLTTANAYPDSLIQLVNGTVLSLNSKPDINDDTTLYSGTFTTRPLKLGSSLQLKTIHQILHLFDTANGKIALRIYGSNDCRNWCELHSLHGKPWKYYTLSYKLSNMLATDAFAGTVVDFQPLFTEKMR